MLRMAGPRMTRNMAGKMKSTVGKSILIGAFIARSSAAACRRRRVSAACTRRMRPSVVPSWSAWMIARAKADSSGASTRSASRFSASCRLSPIRISDSVTPTARLERDEVVGAEEANRTEDESDEDDSGAADGAADDRAEEEAAEQEDALEGEEALRRDRATEPRGEELRADGVDAHPRIDLEHPLREPLAERHDEPVVQPFVVQLRLDLAPPVGGSPPDGEEALARRRRHELADEERGARE